MVSSRDYHTTTTTIIIIIHNDNTEIQTDYTIWARFGLV